MVRSHPADSQCYFILLSIHSGNGFTVQSTVSCTKSQSYSVVANKGYIIWLLCLDPNDFLIAVTAKKVWRVSTIPVAKMLLTLAMHETLCLQLVHQNNE